jgi:hypothetical protein
MTWTVFDRSTARRCKQVGEGFGWAVDSPSPDAARFMRGDKWLVLNFAINGGISYVHTDEGRYHGPNRAFWASQYLRNNGLRTR